MSWQGQPPRDPKVPITNRTAVRFWLLYAVVLFLAAPRRGVRPAEPGPAERLDDTTFVVMGLGTVFNALMNRRDPASGRTVIRNG